MIWIVFAAALAGTPLQDATLACEKDLSACAEKRRLEAEARAGESVRQEQAATAAQEIETQLGRQYLEAQEAEQAANAKAQKSCGGDYRRVRVGMSFKRVAHCAGPFSLTGEREWQEGKAAIWDSAAGWVMVFNNRVVYWESKY